LHTAIPPLKAVYTLNLLYHKTPFIAIGFQKTMFFSFSIDKGKNVCYDVLTKELRSSLNARTFIGGASHLDAEG